jgi:hypothetical protein
MITFASSWATALGPSRAAVTDGGKWVGTPALGGGYDEFNHGDGTQLLSVVTIGGRRALKVLQRGQPYAANLYGPTFVPVSTDYTLKVAIWNDDTSPADDHTVTPDFKRYTGLTYVKRYNGPTDWTFVLMMLGLVAGPVTPYPLQRWIPTIRLAHAHWYRLEYDVHFVDATHIEVRPRIVDDVSGALLVDASGFQQQDYLHSGVGFNKRDDWTLAKYYAAGFTFPVDPVPLQTIALGNNGQEAAVDTGLAWYFAGVEISSAAAVLPPPIPTLAPGSYRLPAGATIVVS